MMDTEIISRATLEALIGDAGASVAPRRLDGRAFGACRPVTVLPFPVAANATPAGMSCLPGASCLAACGGTSILCAVGARVAPTKAGRPDAGRIAFEVAYNAASCFPVPCSLIDGDGGVGSASVALAQARPAPVLGYSSTAAAAFDPAVAGEGASANYSFGWAQEVAAAIEKSFVASSLLRTTDAGLLIRSGEACWELVVTCTVLQDDGAIMTTCFAAAAAALRGARSIPVTVLPDGTEWPDTALAIFPTAVTAPQPTQGVRLLSAAYMVRGAGSSGAASAEDAAVIVDPNAVEAAVADAVIVAAFVVGGGAGTKPRLVYYNQLEGRVPLVSSATDRCLDALERIATL